MSVFDAVLRIIRNDEGQDLAEYGIALAIIAIGAILIAFAIGTDVQTLWSNSQGTIHLVATAG
jgi:Flp pilus assembly pilin Flp